MRTHRLGPSLSVPLLIVSCSAEPGGIQTGVEADEPVGSTEQRVADTSGTDVVADAPWRVQNLDTPIPFEIAIVDAWLRPTSIDAVNIYWEKPGQDALVYHRDFDGTSLSSSEFTRYFWVLHIDEFLGVGARDGSPITARALAGDGAAGQDLTFRVEVNAPVLLRNALNVSRLRVHVGEATLPHGAGLFSGWTAGDLHAHAMYTNNFAEFGLPHRSLVAAGRAIGLDWAITTDHSCDLDAPCSKSPINDNVGSRVERWTFCENGQALAACTQRSHVGWANGWLMANDDATDAVVWAGGGFTLHTGEEVTLQSTEGATIHALAFGTGYIEAKSSGAANLLECDPLTLKLGSMLDNLPANGMVFAAHPTQPLPSAVSGGAWSEEDVQTALGYAGFRGLQLWNTRKTKSGSGGAIRNPYEPGGLDPFATATTLQPCDATSDPECYPSFLDQQALPYWDALLSANLHASHHQLHLLGGSDAHGDFNYYTGTNYGLNIDIVTDNAFGKVRTVVFTPSLSELTLLEALRAGRAVVTDGPMMTFGIDRTADGSLGQAQDTHVGASVDHATDRDLELALQWQSTEEFGAVSNVVLLRGTATTGSTPDAYDVLVDAADLGDCDAASHMAGSCTLTLSHSGPLALPSTAGERHYYRAIAWAGTNNQYRCMTNPIWITGSNQECTDADQDDFGVGPDCTAVGTPLDCNDSAATCTTDCATDVDLDGIPDCRDGCLDVDKDGYGTAGPGAGGCLGADCDDARLGVHPGAPEVCNGIDDNCDGLTDDLPACAEQDAGAGGAAGAGAGGSGGAGGNGGDDDGVGTAGQADDATSDGGCGCATPRSSPSSATSWLAIGWALAAFANRRRRHRPPSK